MVMNAPQFDGASGRIALWIPGHHSLLGFQDILGHHQVFGSHDVLGHNRWQGQWFETGAGVGLHRCQGDQYVHGLLSFCSGGGGACGWALCAVQWWCGGKGEDVSHQIARGIGGEAVERPLVSMRIMGRR